MTSPARLLHGEPETAGRDGEGKLQIDQRWLIGLIYRPMARSKTSKSQVKLTIVPPADEPTSSLRPEQADELRELI